MNKFGRSLPSKSKGIKVLPSQNILTFTRDGDYNMRDRKLCNVKDPTEGGDAVNKKYLDYEINIFTSKCIEELNNRLADYQKNFDIVIENLEKRMKTSSKIDVDDTANQLRDTIVKFSLEHHEEIVKAVTDSENRLKDELVIVVRSEADKVENALKDYTNIIVENSLKQEIKKVAEELIKKEFVKNV